MADTTLIEELEQAAQLADDCGFDVGAARLRARVKHVRQIVVDSGADQPFQYRGMSGDAVASLVGPIPPSDETGGER